MHAPDACAGARCKRGAAVTTMAAHPDRDGRPMRSSFAYILLLSCALAVTGCATLPPPTRELADAQSAVQRAEQADADQHAAGALNAARAGLSQAQAALSAGREADARALALRAAADADLARARSREAVAIAERERRRAEIAELNARLQAGGAP